MSVLPIGIAAASLQLPLKKALVAAAQMGAQGIEIDARRMIRPRELSDTALRHIRKMLDDLNLRVASVRFSTRRGYDVLEDLDRRMDATREALRFAYRLGTPVVVNAVGQVPEQTDSPEYQLLQSCLEDIASWSERIGAMLACETGTEPIDRLVGLLDSLRHQTIGIALNPGNLIIQGWYDDSAIQKCGNRTQIVIARDAVRDTARGRGLEVPLGEGSADFPAILGVLEQYDYRGWLIADRQQSADPQSDLENAVKYLSAIQL